MATRGTLSSERGFTMAELLVSSAVMVIVLGVSTGVLVQSSSVFVRQQVAMNGRSSAAASVDLITRLLRQSSCISSTDVYCQAILPDPDGNGVFDSVLIRSDWNPRDGDLDDPYENVLFVVDPLSRQLLKREPADTGLVPFGDGVLQMRFTYTNQNGGPLANPVARPDLIGGVTITVVTEAGRGLPPVTSSSTVSVRRIK
jgi:prepilin-type N-terminal cleavage/methylation domain-containing protein